MQRTNTVFQSQHSHSRTTMVVLINNLWKFFFLFLRTGWTLIWKRECCSSCWYRKKKNRNNSLYYTLNFTDLKNFQLWGQVREWEISAKLVAFWEYNTHSHKIYLKYMLHSNFHADQPTKSIFWWIFSYAWCNYVIRMLTGSGTTSHVRRTYV